LRHKHYTVAKFSVTWNHQTGLTKNAWVGMAKEYTDTPICSPYVTWLTQDGVWNPMDKTAQARQLIIKYKIWTIRNQHHFWWNSAWLEETHWLVSLEGQQTL